MLGAVKSITTRKGEPMMFVRLDDLEGSVEVVVVPAVMADARDLLTMDAMVLITGRIDQKGEGETKLVAQSVRAFRPEEGGEQERLVVKVDMARLARDPARRAAAPAGRPPGATPRWSWTSPPARGAGACSWARSSRSNPRANSLVAELKTLFGERCVV